jgi:hypothetical protein
MKLYIIALIALAGCCFFIGWDNKPEEQKNNLKSAYVVSLYEFRSKADYNKFWNK